MNRGSSKQPYWVAAERWTEAAVDAAVLAMVETISGRVTSWTKPERQRFRELIFNLSMNSLPEASSGYYWPELHREVSRRLPTKVLPPTEPELTRFGRELFEKTDAKALDALRAQGIHHCFLALIIEQAGIGKNRNKVIRQFLSWLVDNRFSLQNSQDRDWARKAVRSFSALYAQEQASEILLLGPVLEQIGKELVALVGAIENRSDRIDAIEWTWDQLRGWWLKESGFDLDALTPSAASVLQEFLSRLSSVWRRSEVFRLSRLGRIECRWPDGSSASTFASHRLLPIGVATLTSGGATQSIEVIDQAELSLQQVDQVAPNVWHSVGETYFFKTADVPFAEHHPDLGSVRSVPVFVNARDGAPGLHFYGAEARDARPSSKSAIRIPARFKWRTGRLFAMLGSPRTSAEDGDEYKLMLGEREVWSGAVRGGRLSDWAMQSRDVAQLMGNAETAIRIRLLRNGLEAATGRIVVRPLREPPFLVSGSSVHSESGPILRWVETGEESWRTVLVASVDEPDISLVDVHEISRREILVAGHRLLEIGLSCANSAHSSVRTQDKNWSIEHRRSPRLFYQPDKEVVRDALTFAGAGNIRVIPKAEDAILGCDGPLPGDDWGIWIASDEGRWFCDSNQVTSVQAEGAIDIARLATLGGTPFRTGALQVRAGTVVGPGEISFNFFVPPMQTQVETSQLGEVSRVRCWSADDPEWLESDSPISMADVSECKFCRATLRGERWEVGARWVPVIADLLVDGAIGHDLSYTYRLLAQVHTPNEIVCRLISTNPRQISAALNGTSIETGAESTFDLLPMVRSVLQAQHIEEASLIATLDRTTIKWVIDGSPVVRSASYEVISEVNGLIQLGIELRIASLFPTELTLEVADKSSDPFSRHFVTSPGKAFEETARHAVHVERPSAVESLLEVRVRHRHRVIHASPLSLPSAVTCPTAKQAIGSLVRGYRDTGAPAYLRELLLHYLEEFEQARGTLPVASLSAKVATGANPESETCLAVSLKVLANLISGANPYVALPSSTRVDPSLSALTSSIWLLASRRLAAAGQLRPDEFARAVRVTRAAVANPDARIAEMAQIASSFSRSVERAEKLPTGIQWADSETVAAEPISSMRLCVQEICPELNDQPEDDE